MRVADVDRRRGTVPVHVGLGEEPALGVEVGLERPVEVEVVLREVREDERAEARPDEALELGGVRGGLHRAAPVARVEQLTERALEVDRLGRRARDGAPLAADAHLDRAEQARPAAGRGEDRVEEERRGRLAVRAGDAGDLELARRPAEERVGGERHAPARASGDDELGHGEVERALDEQRDRPALDGVRGEVVAVGALAGHADEERARRHSAGVVGEVGDARPTPGLRRASAPTASASVSSAMAVVRHGQLVRRASRFFLVLCHSGAVRPHRRLRQRCARA